MTSPGSPNDAPRSEKEALLARVWEDVLRLDEGEVGTEDDFFDLGGHSLAAAQLSSRVEQGFGVHVSMPLFMEDPTPGGLLDRIEALQRDGTAGEVMTVEDLTAEAVLDPEIAPQPAVTVRRRLRDAGDVFLTGTTGFLGAFLLDGLLASTGRPRPLPRQAPRGCRWMQSIEANLRRYGLWRPELAERIVPVAGDLGKPLFGLDEGEFDALAREVDLIFHPGAVVNLVYPYSELKAPNVGGTREVLRLACRHGAKPVTLRLHERHLPTRNGALRGRHRPRRSRRTPARTATASPSGSPRSWCGRPGSAACRYASTAQATSRATARPGLPTRATCSAPSSWSRCGSGAHPR